MLVIVAQDPLLLLSGGSSRGEAAAKTPYVVEAVSGG